VRAAVTAAAEEHRMPPENLVAPEAVRRLAWSPPQEVTVETVRSALSSSGARAWQVLLVAEVLTAALPEPPAQAAAAPG